MAQHLLDIADARARVLAAAISMPTGTEQVPVQEALGRVLAAEVRAVGDTPPFDCSAMDGYAIEPGAAGRTLSVAGEARAGAPAAVALSPGQAIRISTGAAVPGGAGAVIRQEDVERENGAIVTQVDVREGENVRGAGEDMRAGSLVLSPGVCLGPAELGAAIGAGAGELTVAIRPRVAVLSTGDELQPPGSPLGPGQIHNSNGAMLAALATRAGAEVTIISQLPDDAEATRAGLSEALEAADAVLIAGGVSVGPHDHVKPALAELGVQEEFWGVALQPGKPTWFGTLPGKLVFGLPGNPVSAYVTFVLFAAPALGARQGAPAHQGPLDEARLAVSVAMNGRREQALRVRLHQEGQSLLATPNGPQGSHIVTSLVGADALALIPAGQGELPPGTPVRLVSLSP